MRVYVSAVLVAFSLFVASHARAACTGTSYTVDPSAPATANWTDPVWIPAGSPGSGACDSATNNGVATVLTIDSVITNPISDLTWNCSSCEIHIVSGGQLTISTSGSVASGASIVIDGGTLVVDTPAATPLTFQSGASMKLRAGTLSGSGVVQFASGATLDYDSNAWPTISGVIIENAGTINFAPSTPNDITVTGGAQIHNSSTGSLVIGNNLDSIYCGGLGTEAIENGGLVEMDGSGLTTVHIKLDNLSGATGVHVNSGTLSLAAGGNGDAPFVIESGAVLDFPSGCFYSMTPNGVVSGAGTLAITGGTLSIGGVTAAQNFTLTAGTLTGAGFLTVAHDFRWSGGTITGTGGTQIEGTGEGYFDGADGPMDLDGRAFDVYGYVEYASSTNFLTLSNGATLAVYGTFDAVEDGTIACNCTVPSLLKVAPNGFFIKSDGVDTLFINVPTSNSNVIGVDSGTIEFTADNTHTGALFGSFGTTLRFSAPSTTMNGFLSTDGDVAFVSGWNDISGLYAVSGKTTIDADATFHDFAITNDFDFFGGTLNVYDFEMDGIGTWTGGTLTGTQFTLGGDAELTLDATTGMMTLGCALTNYGTINYAPQPAIIGDSAVRTDGLFVLSGNLELQNGVIYNNGVFDLQNDAPITIGSILVDGRRTRSEVVLTADFNNAGTLQKSGGTGTTSFEPTLLNSADVLAMSGTLDVTTSFEQTDGSTQLNGGSISGAPLVMSGGTLSGSGLADVDVQNDGGTVAPGTATTTGIIDIGGDYTQSSSAAMDIKIGGSTSADYDQVKVTGSVTLDGDFTATLINGYAPPNNTSFTVLTFATRSGSFVEHLPTYNPPLGSFTSSMNPNDYTLTAVLAPSADLSITKDATNGVTAGQDIVYTIVVTNDGPDAAANVAISDPPPANLTFVSNSGDCNTNWPCNFATLASGQSVTITSTYSTSASFSGNVSNTATVSSTTFDPDSSDLTATKVTNVGAQANLSIIKSGPATVTPGQDVVYTITINNAGPSPATNVVVNDPTPIGIAFQSNTGACATPFPCNLGTLNSGSSQLITATYTVPANYSGPSISNTASIASDVNDPDTSDNASAVTTTIAPQADLAIAKSGPASVSPGQLITYTINVSNLGPSTATSVVVDDPAPAGLTPIANTGDCTTAFPCNFASLASGASLTINATFSVPPNYGGASITNTATVGPLASDPSTSNNTSSVTTPVVAQSDVAIVKTGPASFSANADVSYTIVVTNNGPLVANNVFVDDPTPSGVTFVSNGGACTGSFPCALGSLGVGQSATINTTFHVPASYAGTTLVNTASVSSSTIDVNSLNNSSSVTTPRAAGGIADLAVQQSGPTGSTGGIVEFIIAITNNGPNAATGVMLHDPTPAGLSFFSASAPCADFPCALGTIAPLQTVVVHAKFFVQATPPTTVTNTASVTTADTDPVSANNSASVTLQVQAPSACPSSAPQLIAPAAGSILGSPVTLSWSAVADATQYVVTITGAGTTKTINTASTTTTTSLSPGPYTWTVAATADASCPARTSASGSFSICGGTLGAPVASAVAETTTGQTYAISWSSISGASGYELQQASDSSFTNPLTMQVAGLSQPFTKTVSEGTAFFYRVRALSACGATGPYSTALRVAVVPVPDPNATTININVPLGSTTPVTWQIFVPGVAGGTTTFIATVDKPWLSVTPVSGVVPPTGMLLTMAIDPSTLTDGTWTGTLIVVYGSTTVARSVATNGNTPPFVVPVSVSLVSPVTPVALNTPAASAVIIPAVGHLAGLSSTWRSDVRLANTSALLQKYRVTFNSGDGNAAELKSTSVSVDAGATTALDDVVRKWFGTGSLGESSNGALIIEPLDGDGKVSPVPSTTTAVSSRTYNASSNGTLGQFIPALPFASFITKSANSFLSLQQLAQTSTFRSNLGLLEASGKSASVLVSVFNDLGVKLADLPLTLRGGEQRQLNAFLSDRGLTLPNARIQVGVTDGEGRVTTYASVVDNNTGDPFLVFGVPVGGAGATRFVVPGVADLQGGSASWRTDVRLFNGGTIPQNATLTFFPTGDPAHSVSKSASINPGEVKALDAVLQSLFGLSNTGGALHVTTPSAAPLVVTARTYDQRPGGTVGQFVPAVAPSDSVGFGGRSLQILQTEESARFRTNVGIAEMSGQSAVVEIEVHLPDSKITPVVRVPLAANEFRQLPILGSLNLGALYNTRIAVRVVEGDGRVTAYGSVIDRETGDPTYIPAQ